MGTPGARAVAPAWAAGVACLQRVHRTGYPPGLPPQEPMPHLTLTLPPASPEATEPAWSPSPDQARPLPTLSGRSGAWVVVAGACPLAHPDLEGWVRDQHQAGVKVQVESLLPEGWTPPPAWGHQLGVLRVVLPPDAAALPPVPPLPGDTHMEWLWLLSDATAHQWPLFAEALSTGHTVVVRRARAPLSARTLHALLPTLRRQSDAAGWTVRTEQLAGSPPRPDTGPPEPLGPTGYHFLWEDVPDPSLGRGITLDATAAWVADRGGRDEVLRFARAMGVPVDPTPPPGPALAPPPGPQVHVVNPPMQDKVLTLSSLPRLAEALAERGQTVRYHSAWGPAGPLATSGPARRQAMARAASFGSDFVDGLSFEGADQVIVPGWKAARAVWDHPTLPRHCRVVVLDYHMLKGIEAWDDVLIRGPGGKGWPSDRLVVHACFPRHAVLYVRRGVPLRQVHWRPYPFSLADFAPSDLPAEGPWFAGGNQFRDWPTLYRAVAGAPELPSLQLFSRSTPPAPPTGVDVRGTTDLMPFFQALSASQVVVMPLVWRPHIASGLTVLHMALAAGRPVVASRTPATLEALTHGENGLLVPPGSPKALGAALRALAKDPSLLEGLARGARRAGQRASVAQWADELSGGRSPSA